MTECSLILKENPLADFVELPEKHQGLFYSNILCGVIKGALTAVHQDVQCSFVQDVLLGKCFLKNATKYFLYSAVFN